MSLAAPRSGRSILIFTARRPGRRMAGSMRSWRLLAPMTMTLRRPSTPDVEADPVISDRAADLSRLVLQSNAHVRRSSVFSHVVERFLNDSVKGCLDRGPRPALHRALHGDRKPRPLGDPFSQEFDGREQPQVVQDRRTELMREASQLLRGFAEEPPDFLKALVMRPPRQIPSKLIEGDIDTTEKLSCLVVE